MHIPLDYNQKSFWLDPIVECRAEDGRELVIEINANGRIGEGGNAVVYRCVDQVTGEDYAIKIQMQRGFKRLKLNCVQVAFGKDADGDGVLGADETETP
jgi:hypothetical protein